jgi:muconolactone D-isomerase
MEFLVEFDLRVPEGAQEAEVNERVRAEAEASAELGRQGHLVRLWRPPLEPGERKAVGL